MKAHVYVTLKRTVLDAQGQTVAGALRRMGLNGVADVRQGKYFLLTLEDSLASTPPRPNSRSNASPARSSPTPSSKSSPSASSPDPQPCQKLYPHVTDREYRSASFGSKVLLCSKRSAQQAAASFAELWPTARSAHRRLTPAPRRMLRSKCWETKPFESISERFSEPYIRRPRVRLRRSCAVGRNHSTRWSKSSGGPTR